MKLSVPEIRRSIAKAVIIGGAYAGIPQGYIRGCFRAGLAEHVDKISYHPYRAIPEKNYDAEIAGLRRIIAESKKPLGLWQGENGCPSQRGGAGALANLAWTERSQAKWLLRRILTDLRLEIELVSYYHLVNLVGYRGTTNHKGLLRGNDYTPKPAYFAYQCLCSLFDARSVRDAGLDLGVVGQEKVDLQWTGFSRGGRAMYVYWFPANLQEPWPPRKLERQAARHAAGGARESRARRSPHRPRLPARRHEARAGSRVAGGRAAPGLSVAHHGSSVARRR